MQFFRFVMKIIDTVLLVVHGILDLCVGGEKYCISS